MRETMRSSLRVWKGREKRASSSTLSTNLSVNEEISTTSNRPHCPRDRPRKKGGNFLQRTDMQTLGLGDRIVPIPRQRDAPPRLLVSRPGQRRIEVVAPVHEDRAGLDLVDEVQVRLLGAGPDRRGEAVPRIVDQGEGFGVVFDLPWGGVGRAVLENIVEHFGMSPVRSLLGRKERQQERERERAGNAPS